MKCLVTAGPTFEGLDDVRRLTNFSTGQLGTDLAGFLARKGHEVILLRGQQSTCPVPFGPYQTVVFTTTANLEQHLRQRASVEMEAVFHAAAICDFQFGGVWEKGHDDRLIERHSGKFSTRGGDLFVKLCPTPKIIRNLRSWFPRAFLAGWKYEVENSRDSVISKASLQIKDHGTDACVANGPAYGDGYGLVLAEGLVQHCGDRFQLFIALEHLALSRQSHAS